MGYRSCVALMVYGEPSKVDVVDNLLLQKLDPEYDRDMFERVKQTHEENNVRSVLWTFDDIKWYGNLDNYREAVFSWVDEIMTQKDEAGNKDEWWLACDFVRLGEETDDIETHFSYDSEYRLDVHRNINIPTNFEWRD